VVAIAGFTMVLTFLGVHLGRVRVYSEEELAAAREKPLVSFLFNLTHKVRIFEVALDAVLISFAYYLAYALRFGPIDHSINWQLFAKTLPLIVFIKLAMFLVSGTYRGIWRYASLSNVLGFARAVALSSVVSVLGIVFVFQFHGFSRSVFVLDAVLLLVFVTVSRFAFKLLRRLLPASSSTKGRRVLIYGAGDGGELLCRELNNNPGLDAVPVAFVDDDATKTDRFIHGLRVYAARPSVAATCTRLTIDEVLISTAKLSSERLAEIVTDCAGAGIPVTRACMTFQRLKPTDFGWVVSVAPGVVPPGVLITAPPDLLAPTPPQRQTTEH
jgi:UDP-GlcNAc:undecaprenyl-phosphate GlcNAc-1-phosphate transferase